MTNHDNVDKINKWINFYNKKMDKMKEVTIATKANRVFYTHLIKNGNSHKNIVEMIQPYRREQFTKDVIGLVTPIAIKKKIPLWKRFFANMKIIIISLMLISGSVYAGDSTNTDPTPRYRSSGNGYGLMALGGVTLTLGGILTRPEKFYTDDGVWQVKPFHKQGPRASAIVCGVSLTITGLITAIINH